MRALQVTPLNGRYFGTRNDGCKEEVADTKCKRQLPIQEGLVNIRLFPRICQISHLNFN